MNRIERFFDSRYFWPFIVVINIVLPLLVFASFNEHHFRIYFNSDTLYLASIYKDLFVDGTGFKGWNLNGAPNFFPDMLLYFIVRFFSPDFKVAYIAFSIVQFNLIVYLLGALLPKIKANIPKAYLYFFYLLFPVFLLATIWHGSFQYTFHLFSQSYHNGCFINVLIALNLLFQYLRTGKSKLLIPLILIAFLGAFNDRLFIVILTFPMFLIWILNFLRIKSKEFKMAGISLIGATIVGVLVFNATKWNSIYHCIALGDKFMNFKNFLPSLDIFLNQHIDFLMRHDLRGLILLIMIASVVLFAIYIIRSLITSKWLSDLSKINVREFVFALFALMSVLITLLTPVINGYYVGYACIRYVTFAYFISILNFVLALVLFRINMKVIAGINGVLLLIIGATIVFKTIKDPVGEKLNDVANYYPEKVEKIDAYAQKNNLQYGLAKYWDAKLITMFSKQNLRVYTIINDKLNLWFHVMNSNWYFDYEKGKYNKPRFSFVISDPKGFSETKNLVGAPMDSSALVGGDYLYVIDTVIYDKNTRQPQLLNND